MEGKALFFERLFHAQHVRKTFVLDLNFRQRLLGDFERVCRERADRLPLIEDPLLGEESLVSDRKSVGHVGEVPGSHDSPYTRVSFGVGHVQLDYLRVGECAPEYLAVKHVRKMYVCSEDGRAGDFEVRIVASLPRPDDLVLLFFFYPLFFAHPPRLGFGLAQNAIPDGDIPTSRYDYIVIWAVD